MYVINAVLELYLVLFKWSNFIPFLALDLTFHFSFDRLVWEIVWEVQHLVNGNIWRYRHELNAFLQKVESGFNHSVQDGNARKSEKNKLPSFSFHWLVSHV